VDGVEDARVVGGMCVRVSYIEAAKLFFVSTLSFTVCCPLFV
jgi:hypothetical protein